jgi:signal peptidase II
MITLKRGVFVVFVGTLLVLVDQLFKFLVLRIPEEGFFLFDGLIGLVPVINYGIVLGIPFFSNLSVIFVTLFLLGFVGYFFVQEAMGSHGSRMIWQIFIFAGGVSNLLDRVVHGFVIDYWQIRWFSTFNFADVGVVVGVIGWLLCFRRDDKIIEQGI